MRWGRVARGGRGAASGTRGGAGHRDGNSFRDAERGAREQEGRQKPPRRGLSPGSVSGAGAGSPPLACGRLVLQPSGSNLGLFFLIFFFFYPICEGRSGCQEMRCSWLSSLRGETRGRLGKAGALHPPDIWENAAGWCGYIDFIPLAGLSQVGTPPPEPLGACSGLGKQPWLWASTKYGAVRRNPPSPQWGKTPALCRQPSWKDFITAGIVSTWPSEPCPCLRRRPTPA